MATGSGSEDTLPNSTAVNLGEHAGQADELLVSGNAAEFASLNSFIHQLLVEYWAGNGVNGPLRVLGADTGVVTADIGALTSEGQQLARWALDAWSTFSGLGFHFVSGGNDVRIVFDDERSGGFTESSIVGHDIEHSAVNVSKTYLLGGATIDSRAFYTYLHEIGHALGLGHAGDYNETATYGRDEKFSNDSWSSSIMSYFDQKENTSLLEDDADYAIPVTPMMVDILAIQWLYDTPANWNAGNTVYGFNSNVGGWMGELFAAITGEQANADVYRGRPITLTIQDSGGVDLIDFRTVTSDQHINLGSSRASSILGTEFNLHIIQGTEIEQARGGLGNDTLVGNEFDNTLWGGVMSCWDTAAATCSSAKTVMTSSTAASTATHYGAAPAAIPSTAVKATTLLSDWAVTMS